MLALKVGDLNDIVKTNKVKAFIVNKVHLTAH